MLGNVWDWCRDVYDAEVYGAYRVLRGGGWFDEHWSCRASARGRSGVSVILMTAEDEVLTGGMANAGAVFRRGDLVERPAPRNARALHAHLLALKQHGFDAAPTPVALTSDGREQLTFVPGDVPLPPFPDWAMTGAALASVGSLLRRLHEAGAAVAVDTSAAWPRDLADPEGARCCATTTCARRTSSSATVAPRP